MGCVPAAALESPRDLPPELPLLVCPLFWDDMGLGMIVRHLRLEEGPHLGAERLLLGREAEVHQLPPCSGTRKKSAGRFSRKAASASSCCQLARHASKASRSRLTTTSKSGSYGFWRNNSRVERKARGELP